MKNFLFLIGLLFISSETCAGCNLVDSSTCPTTKCPLGTFMGDDGECYSCDVKEDIEIMCLGREKISEICPNRIILGGCGIRSTLCPQNNCLEGMFMGDNGKCYDCNEDEEISVNCTGFTDKICSNRMTYDCFGDLRSYKCPTGYKNKNGRCCDDKDACIFKDCIA